MLKQSCGLTKPWLYMSEYFENNQEEYYQRLFNIKELQPIGAGGSNIAFEAQSLKQKIQFYDVIAYAECENNLCSV